MKLSSVLTLALLLTACSPPAKEFPVYGDVPHFQLTAQSGTAFDSSELKGNVWVADFIYTTCPGPCPRMTSQMHDVQESVLKHMSGVKLVSFTVDPANDTPPALAAYAKVHGATSKDWYFLTGPQATLQKLDKDVFKLGDVDSTLQHSTRFVLMDRQSRIRGYYDTSEADAINRLVNDINELARQAA